MKTLKLIITFLALTMIFTGCGGGSSDSTAPSVETFYPNPAIDGSVSSADIQANGIKAIFDEGMDPATIDTTSFTVEEWTAGGTAVPGTVTYDESVRTASFVPGTALNTSWDYVVTVTTGVTDLAGISLVVDYSKTITVAAAAPPGSVP